MFSRINLLSIYNKEILKMNNVLVLTTTYPKSREDIVPSFIYDQIQSLTDLKKDVNFIVLAPHYFDNFTIDQLNYKQIRYHYFWPFRFEKLVGRGIIPTIKKNKLYILLVPFFITAQIFVAIKFSIKFKPKVIYAHWFFPQAIVAFIVSKITNIPYVFTTHAYDAGILNKIPILGNYISRVVISNAYKYTAVSQNTLEILHSVFKKNVNNNNSKVLPMPVNLVSNELVDDETKKIFNDYKSIKNKFLFIGRFAEKKGLINLIEIFNELNKNFPHFVLFIAGDGPEKSKIQKLIHKHNLDKKIIILNYLNISQKIYAFDFVDFVVIPSIKTKFGDIEGLPVVLLESLYLGKITISSKYSNSAEIVEDSANGFIFDPLKIENSKEIFLKIINLEESKKRQIIQNAEQTGKNYSKNSNGLLHYNHLFRDILK